MFINQILEGLSDTHKSQLKFLTVLFQTIFVCRSRINFSSLARHSDLNERTYRRNFQKEFDFIALNQTIINRCGFHIEAFAPDASFIKKSESETFGQDKFWNSCLGKAEKGLEALIISLIDVTENVSLVLTVDQTTPNSLIQVEGQPPKTRVDFYAEQLEKVAATILQYTKIGVLTAFMPIKSLLIKPLTWALQ